MYKQVSYGGVDYPFDTFFDMLFGVHNSKTALVKGAISPATDAYLNDTQLVVEYEIPGATESSIEIKLNKSELQVTAEKAKTSEDKLLRAERTYGKYTRVFTLGEEYGADKLEATYKDGILRLVIPRKPEAQPKTFKVK